ncbi:MAG: hypothetical protein CMM07_22840 [Rhodopirellula sp.]|nr:hypothetical protein [Rhodopirellula sp.]
MVAVNPKRICLDGHPSEHSSPGSSITHSENPQGFHLFAFNTRDALARNKITPAAMASVRNRSDSAN